MQEFGPTFISVGRGALGISLLMRSVQDVKDRFQPVDNRLLHCCPQGQGHKTKLRKSTSPPPVSAPGSATFLLCSIYWHVNSFDSITSGYLKDWVATREWFVKNAIGGCGERI